MKQRLLIGLLSVCTAAFSTARAADCASVTINALDAGWYTGTGQHDPNNNNYFCGYLGSGAPFRNWFVFNIPTLTQTVASAVLRIYSADVDIPDFTETLELRHVATPVSTLRAGGNGLTNIYADLGDGTVYGSRTFHRLDDGLFFNISLNAAFLSQLNASAGGTLALGGRIASLQALNNRAEFLFGASGLIGSTNEYVQLLITYSNAGPLAIVEQPVSLALPGGESGTFQVRVCGGGSPAYQWQRSGTNLAGATNPFLHFPSPTSADNGQYRVIVSDSITTVTSSVAHLVISNGVPPSGNIYFAIGQSPILAGSSLSICSSIFGSPAPAYQWQFNGVDLPGQVGSCLGFLSVQTNNSGTYQLIASNIGGVFTSAPISLVVTQAPPSASIFLSFGSLTPSAGTSFGLCSSIGGGPYPLLQWQLNGVNLPGQTNQCFNVGNVQSNNSGSYRIVASNSVGVVTSAPLAVTVQYFAPTGSVFLSSGQLPAPAGSFVSFCSHINGAPFPNLQWQFNGANIPGQNATCLTLSSVSSNNAGSYRLVASNSYGVFTSAPIALNVEYYPPTGSIYLWTGSTPAPAGSRVGFCSSIIAAPSASFQWQRNGTNLLGQNNACLDLFNVSSNDIGSYRLIATNVLGAFTSSPIVLAVNYAAPSGTINPSGVLPPILEGGSLSLCSSIVGAPNPTYQWQHNGTNLPGQISSCMYISGIKTNQSGSYRVIASNSSGTFTSEVAIVSVIHAAPTAEIYRSYGRTPAKVGEDLQMCATLTGAPYPTIQWQFYGTNLPGKTFNCFTLTNLQTNQSGPYTVVASNILGVVTSAPVMITVIEPVPVLAYFASGFPPLAVGSYEYLCSETTLSDVIGRQWQFNGTNILDETNFCLVRYQVQASDAGLYSIVVTSAMSGSFTSPPINLTVFYRPPSSATPQFSVGGSSVLVGQDVGLYASYSGSPGFVQWYFNGVELAGQTNGAFTMLNVSTNQAGLYSFIVTNAAGAATSSVVSLTVNYQAPVWVHYSGNQFVTEGAKTRFVAYALAGPPPTYYLQFNGTNIAAPFTFEGCCGVSSGGFSLLDTTFTDAGNYHVIASNFLGSITSIVSTLTVLPAGPLDRWTQRNPLPQSQPLLSVAHGTNQFVAVGDRGTILTSADGSNWTLQNRRADVELRGVVYGDGLFIAVGESGTILSSTDGTNWSYRYTAPLTDLNAVTYGEGRFVAVGVASGINTLVMHSTNGIQWERVSITSLSANQCIAYGNGLFVAGGTSALMYSGDGINWIHTQNVNRQIESITYAANRYVAVGDDGRILVSTDAVSWVARTAVTSRRLLGVTYGAGLYVAAGARGTMLTSPDATTWTIVNSGTPDRLESIDFSGELFVSAGENGTIIISTNGTSWTRQNIGITRDLDGMAVAGGTLVVVGKGGNILTSTDGTYYTIQNAGVTNDLHGVFWGGGLWVAVGEPGIVLTSSNAIDWVNRPTDTFSSLKDGTWANGKWFAVGTQGTVVTSTNGVDWTSAVVSPAFDLNDIAYGNGTYLIAGDGAGNQNGSLFSSVNGVNWTVSSPYFGKNLRGILFAEDRFLIAGNDGLIAVIPTVGNISATFQFGDNLRGSTRAPGLWATVGNFGVILTTHLDPTNGVIWTQRASRTFENFHQVAYINGTLVAIGNRGTILQSGRFVPELEPPLFTGGSAIIPFKGVHNQDYVLQYSTNLATWTPVITFTNTAERVLFNDSNAWQSPFRFYRVVEP